MRKPEIDRSPRPDIEAGDHIRCPASPTARWRRVLRVYRRSGSGEWIVAFKRGREGRRLGLPVVQRLQWYVIASIGYEVRKRSNA